MATKIREARKRLGALWLGATAVTFLIMVGRSLGSGFGDQVIDAWGWYLPTLFPTLGLILATFGLDLERRKPKKPGTVEGFYYRLCWWMSVFYLANLLLIVVVPADLLPAMPNPIEAMAISNLWIGPLQGLTAASLAWFFLNAQADSGAA